MPSPSNATEDNAPKQSTVRTVIDQVKQQAGILKSDLHKLSVQLHQKVQSQEQELRDLQRLVRALSANQMQAGTENEGDLKSFANLISMFALAPKPAEQVKRRVSKKHSTSKNSLLHTHTHEAHLEAI